LIGSYKGKKLTDGKLVIYFKVAGCRCIGEGMGMQPPKNFVPEPFEYHQEVEVTVESLTNLGMGVARVDGWVVMVPFVIPGERVKARIYRNFQNYSDADLVEVLEASPDRVEPRCPLYQKCGGCQYQHMTYERQLKEKTKHVEELMQKLGEIDHPVQLSHGSPKEYNYRSKITPHYERPGKDGSQPIGFLQYGRRNQIIDVEQCPIATEAINAALPEARDEARRSGGKKRRQRGGTILMRDVIEGVVTDPQEIVSERVGNHTFQFKAGEFFQNNPFILPELVEHVAREASMLGARYLVDAYCGVGLFALSTSKSFELSAGVEISEPAVRWAQANATICNIKNVRFVIGKAEAIFNGLKFSGEETAVVIDPPRKGCDASFRQQLMQFRPQRIVYVSCDPATQARDLKEFVEAGYDITLIQPFDLFPHTRHIENVVSLTLSSRPPLVATPEAEDELEGEIEN
jgi:23S rRNA (uracil1939-C5)-methyltransferase/tRNA (uracil-5-)-methyltransferase